MDDFVKQLKSLILESGYYDETKSFVAVIKKEELAKLLKADIVKFDD